MHILWEAAGRPGGEGEDKGTCRVCGQQSLGLSFSHWARPTFTDWDKLQPGNIICHACQFCFAEQSELLAQRVGKEKPQRMRNYSHFVVDGKWLPLSKAQKAQMTYLLLYESPEVTIIAQSGQKHIIFRAIPGIVQFEEQQISDWRGLGELLATIETLYNGFSKSEIETGDYAQHRVLKFGTSFWWELESALRSRRQTALFGLALFLAQRKEKEKDESIKRVAQPGGKDARSGVAGYPIQLQIPL